MQISHEQGGIVFSNPITSKPGANIMQPGKKGEDSEGLGQGLYLVTRIIEELGWNCAISTDDGQYRFTVVPA